MGVIFPFFQKLGNKPFLVIVLKIFDKSFDNLTGNDFTKSFGISRGHNEVLFSLRIFASMSTACTQGYPGLVLGAGEYYMREHRGFVQ